MNKLVATIVAVMVFFSGSAFAGAEEAKRDPVVADVIRMLEAGVSPELVSAWLSRNTMKPKEVSADDVIELTRVKAPAPLVDLLMQLAAGVVPPPAAPLVAPESAPLVTEPAERSVATLPATPAPTMAPAPSPMGEVAPTARQDALVTFMIDYRPDVEEYQEPHALFVYVDGRPLASTEGGSAVSFAFNDKMRFSVPMSAGRHIVAVTQERHKPISKKRGKWEHEARAFTRPIVVDLSPGSNAELEIRVDERVIPGVRERGPVSYTIAVNGEPLEAQEHLGPVTSRWPEICEEIETRFDEDDRRKSSFRDAMRGCVRWASLFPEVTEVPTREAVRAELQTYDFRPQPVGVR